MILICMNKNLSCCFYIIACIYTCMQNHLGGSEKCVLYTHIYVQVRKVCILLDALSATYGLGINYPGCLYGSIMIPWHGGMIQEVNSQRRNQAFTQWKVFQYGQEARQVGSIFCENVDFKTIQFSSSNIFLYKLNSPVFNHVNCIYNK